jgi:hypothetical protein
MATHGDASPQGSWWLVEWAGESAGFEVVIRGLMQGALAEPWLEPAGWGRVLLSTPGLSVSAHPAGGTDSTACPTCPSWGGGAASGGYMNAPKTP